MSESTSLQMKSICSTCNRPTNQTVLFEKRIDVNEEESGWWDETRYQVIQCQGCDTISFRRLYTDISMYPSDDEFHGTQDLYPKRTINTLPIKTFLNTPNNIKKIYRETIDAFNNDLYILASAGLRAIIEGICNEKGIKGGDITNSDGKVVFSKNLDGKIEGLATMGFLTAPNAAFLHELRFLGNAAVHSLSTPSTKELKLAINIIEHTIDNIYEMEQKASELRKEIAKRNIP